jgi:tRNA(fMet)-specific endonuclease VapC
MEIAYGLHRAGRDKQLGDFEAMLTTCDVIAFDAEAGLLAGRIDADLERAGTPVNAADVMIAAMAVRAALPVVTGNVAHFASIAKLGYALAIENWRA